MQMRPQRQRAASSAASATTYGGDVKRREMAPQHARQVARNRAYIPMRQPSPPPSCLFAPHSAICRGGAYAARHEAEAHAEEMPLRCASASC